MHGRPPGPPRRRVPLRPFPFLCPKFPCQTRMCSRVFGFRGRNVYARRNSSGFSTTPLPLTRCDRGPIDPAGVVAPPLGVLPISAVFCVLLPNERCGRRREQLRTPQRWEAAQREVVGRASLSSARRCGGRTSGGALRTDAPYHWPRDWPSVRWASPPLPALRLFAFFAAIPPLPRRKFYTATRAPVPLGSAPNSARGARRAGAETACF